MVYAKNFIHARSDGVDRSGATDFVVELRRKFFSAGANLFALLVVGIPSVFGFGAGVLAKGGKSNLRKAVFDNFVAFGELVFFPKAEFAGGLL